MNRRVTTLVTVVAIAAIAGTVVFWLNSQTHATVTFWHTDTTSVVPVDDHIVTLATLTGTTRQQHRTTIDVQAENASDLTLTQTVIDDTTSHLKLDTLQLPEGTHQVTLTTANGDTATLTLLIDRTAPAVSVSLPDRHIIAGETFTLTGHTDPSVTVRVNDTTVVTDATGRFALDVTHRSDVKQLTATDAAGNITTETLTLTVIPSRVENTEIRALHVSFHAWGDPARRARIDRLLDAGIVNAIQFDIKDESGHVGHRSSVAFANDTGAALNLYDLADVVTELHARNVAVIGRIVAFADPVIARYAYQTNQRDLAIQTPSGALYTGNYQGFTNFTHPTIITYTIDLAVEAATAGVDHILWDYLRRPDGRLSQIVIPGLVGPVEDAIVAFTEQADTALHPWRVQHGASLYGISADRPREIGQDVARLRHHLDYVAPMIYPSHWGPGEYGVTDPNRQPRAIVQASLGVWLRATDGARARVIPWLEDTSYRAYDRPNHVREQHRGTYVVGLREWLMWDAASRFTPNAYDVAPPQG